jgi:hypothetical protein
MYRGAGGVVGGGIPIKTDITDVSLRFELSQSLILQG